MAAVAGGGCYECRDALPLFHLIICGKIPLYFRAGFYQVVCKYIQQRTVAAHAGSGCDLGNDLLKGGFSAQVVGAVYQVPELVKYDVAWVL